MGSEDENWQNPIELNGCRVLVPWAGYAESQHCPQPWEQEIWGGATPALCSVTLTSTSLAVNQMIYCFPRCKVNNEATRSPAAPHLSDQGGALL